MFIRPSLGLSHYHMLDSIFIHKTSQNTTYNLTEQDTHWHLHMVQIPTSLVATLLVEK